jgi:hypothetical protein
VWILNRKLTTQRGECGWTTVEDVVDDVCRAMSRAARRKCEEAEGRKSELDFCKIGFHADITGWRSRSTAYASAALVGAIDQRFERIDHPRLTSRCAKVPRNKLFASMMQNMALTDAAVLRPPTLCVEGLQTTLATPQCLRRMVVFTPISATLQKFRYN